MENRKALTDATPRAQHPPHPVTQKKALIEMISRQIEAVIHPYAAPKNYRLKIEFDRDCSNLLANPKRCAFKLELCILDPYFHMVIKKVAGSFQDAINQAVCSMEKNLKLVTREKEKTKRSLKLKRRAMLASALLVPVVAILSGLGGCAHKRMEKEIDAKLQHQEPQITTQDSLQKEAYEAVEEDPNLTQDQKKKLLELQEATRTQLTSLKENGIQLRSLLINDLLAQEDTSDEVALIKRRIKKNENEKLKTLFSAIEKTNVILGKDTKIRGKMLQAFMDRHWTSDMRDDNQAQKER